jgi:hypothetical protein
MQLQQGCHRLNVQAAHDRVCSNLGTGMIDLLFTLPKNDSVNALSSCYAGQGKLLSADWAVRQRDMGRGSSISGVHYMS